MFLGKNAGPDGINHGVERQPRVITFAREKLGVFKMNTDFDKSQFCEPVFTVGNCLSLDTDGFLYDRVYCGATCPPKYENYMKMLLNVNGILVMPFNNEVGAKSILPVLYCEVFQLELFCE